MLKKFLREVVVTIVGKQAEEVADLLNTKNYVNEFLIAKKLDLTVNQTRNILYKISDYGLVSFIRKKDKKKGWYTYFWRMEVLKSLEFLKSILVKKIDQINYQVKSRETKEFYICERCNVEFNEENVLLYDFTCNECGDVFTIKNNKKLLGELKKNLAKIEKELGLIEEEIRKEKERLEKERMRMIKKEEKEKAIKSVATIAKRKAARKLIAKKTAKKKPVKKKAIKKKSVRRSVHPKMLNSKAKKKPKKKLVKCKKKSAKKKVIKKKIKGKK